MPEISLREHLKKFGVPDKDIPNHLVFILKTEKETGRKLNLSRYVPMMG